MSTRAVLKQNLSIKSNKRSFYLPEEQLTKLQKLRLELAALQELEEIAEMPDRESRIRSHKDLLRRYHPDKNPKHVQVNGLHGWAAEKPCNIGLYVDS